MSEFLPKNAKFSLGQIVYHSFKYRGNRDGPNFQGTDEWYESVAKSKPDKNKPWYHVLVHGQGNETYVAESNLTTDDNIDPVDHPFRHILNTTKVILLNKPLIKFETLKKFFPASDETLENKSDEDNCK